MKWFKNENYLKRTRIEEMLKTGMKYPLMILSAAPGYGKTSVVMDFLEIQDLPFAWISLSSFDNNTALFWDELEKSFRKEFPEIADVFSGYDFPDNTEKLIEFKNRISHVEVSVKEMIVAIDNYDLLTDPKILTFLYQVLQMTESLDLTKEKDVKIHYIVLTNKNFVNMQNPFYDSFLSIGAYYKIGMKELAFTRDELEEFYLSADVQKSSEELDDLIEQSEGWPVYHKLMCSERSKEDALTSMFELFEFKYFMHYSKDVRLLLIKLSILPFFTSSIIHHFYDGDIHLVMDIIQDNVFIVYEYHTHLFRLHKVYHNFLNSKEVFIDIDEKKRLINIASDCLLDMGMYAEAKDLFQAAGNHVQFFNDPRVLWNLASVHLKKAEVEQAKSCFLNLLGQLNKDDDLYQIAEIHCNLAGISLLENNLEGLNHLKEAESLISGQQIRLTSSVPLTRTTTVFFMPSDVEITVEEMIDYIYQMHSYWNRISADWLCAYALLFQGEASFMMYQLTDAENYVIQAVNKAKAMKQQEIVLVGNGLLLRIALCRGSFKQCRELMMADDAYLSEKDNLFLAKIIDIGRTHFNIVTGNDAEVADWIKMADLIKCANEEIRDRYGLFICSSYALYHNDAQKALSLLNQLEVIAPEKQSWSLVTNILSMKTCIYYHLNDYEAAVSCFDQLYQMTYPHKIYFPLVGFGNLITPMLDYLLKQELTRFNPEWITSLKDKNKEYMISLAKIQLAMNRNKSNHQYSISLSRRELVVLEHLSHGHSREEIAEAMDITINGVKKHLSNIYTKLGANNRTDAVYIATQKGMI